MAPRHARTARRLHEHKAVIAHALRQHAGIPYEIEQRVCSDCHRVLDERTVRAIRLILPGISTSLATLSRAATTMAGSWPGCAT